MGHRQVAVAPDLIEQGVDLPVCVLIELVPLIFRKHVRDHEHIVIFLKSIGIRRHVPAHDIQQQRRPGPAELTVN